MIEVFLCFKFVYNFVFVSSVNVNASAAEERVLLTGLHQVADIYCGCCKILLGWKYVNFFSFFDFILSIFVFIVTLIAFSKEHAFESSQKYKEGKYIIELVHMIKDNGWDDENIDHSIYLKK